MWGVFTFAKYDALSCSEGPRVYASGGRRSGFACMDFDDAEVMAETTLHVSA
jgi:hypothetical protein